MPMKDLYFSVCKLVFLFKYILLLFQAETLCIFVVLWIFTYQRMWILGSLTIVAEMRFRFVPVYDSWQNVPDITVHTRHRRGQER